jgi:hypothetical protein
MNARIGARISLVAKCGKLKRSFLVVFGDNMSLQYSSSQARARYTKYCPVQYEQYVLQIEATKARVGVRAGVVIRSQNASKLVFMSAPLPYL